MITSDDILGKDVIDPDGDVLGVASKLHIDDDAYDVVGVTVDQGFGWPSLYIGVSHVKRVGVDAVLLSSRPLSNLAGKDVYSEDGAYIGRVADVASYDDGDVLVVEDGGERRSIAKDRVVQKGDSVIVDYTKP